MAVTCRRVPGISHRWCKKSFEGENGTVAPQLSFAAFCPKISTSLLPLAGLTVRPVGGWVGVGVTSGTRGRKPA